MRVLSASERGLLELGKANDLPADERTRLIREVYTPVETMAQWLYFNSSNREEKKPLTKKQLEQYYAEVKPLIEKVISIGRAYTLTPSATHYLVELCSRVIEFDPRGVIKTVDDLCSLPTGYTFDSFAINEITKLIELSVADYKEALRDEATMKRLVRIIDTFVKAGWSEAIELSLKLDSVWR